MSRIFRPDPPPASMDPIVAEWIIRQLRRITGTTEIIREGGDSTDGRLDDHLADTNNPHATLVPWKVNSLGDLYPDDETGAKDQGIGSIEKSPMFIAFGTQEDAGVSGIEGAISQRNDADGGGLILSGIRDIDPSNPPAPPIAGNAPVEIATPTLLITGGTMWLEVENALAVDHELLIGPSQTLPDGRHFSPVMIGPEKIYTHEESATDNRDIDVLDLGEIEVVSLTLVNSYAADVSTFTFTVLLENLGSRTTLFDVILKVDGVEVIRYGRSLTGNTQTVTDSFTIQIGLTAGQVISMDVEATSTHPQSQGRVRGDLELSTLRVRQG